MAIWLPTGPRSLSEASGGGGLEPVATGFHRLGLRPGPIMATMAAVSEFGGGLLTLTGLADPMGPVAIAGADGRHLRPSSQWTVRRQGWIRTGIDQSGRAVVLAAAGPGRYSLDGLTGRRLPAPLAVFSPSGRRYQRPPWSAWWCELTGLGPMSSRHARANLAIRGDTRLALRRPKPQPLFDYLACSSV